MKKKTISSIIVFILIQILINMLIFIAFIPFVKADEWISPTGNNNPNYWIDEANAYDGDLETKATYDTPYYGWSPALKLTLSYVICSSKIRYYVTRNSAYVSKIKVQVYDVDETTWVNVHEGSITVEQWVEKSFDEKNISMAQFYFYTAYGYVKGYLHEFEFWEITTLPDNAPTYSDVGDDGVTQVGEYVTVSCYWEDDFAIDTCYVEHNSTGTYTNYSIPVSGSSSWANKTFQLNYTSNIKVGYRWFCCDNASQWNITNYSYITTTPLYITFNLNNATRGRFYVDLVNTANNTQYGYNYNQSILLLGATYNNNYIWSNFTYSNVNITTNFYNYLTNGNNTIWCNFDIANITSSSGSGNYTETDLHEYFVLGAVIGGVCCVVFAIIIIGKEDLIRGK